jgi:hypothetical protein
VADRSVDSALGRTGDHLAVVVVIADDLPVDVDVVALGVTDLNGSLVLPVQPAVVDDAGADAVVGAAGTTAVSVAAKPDLNI